MRASSKIWSIRSWGNFRHYRNTIHNHKNIEKIWKSGAKAILQSGNISQRRWLTPMFQREKVSEERSYFHILPFFSFSSPNFRLLWHPLPDLPSKKGARFLQTFVWTVKGHFFRVCTYHIEHNKNQHKSFTVYSKKNDLFHSIIVILDQVSSKILQEMCFNIVSSQMLCFATQRDECWVLCEDSAESVLLERQGKAERRDDFAWKRQVLSVSHQPMFCKRFTSLLLIRPSFVSNFNHGVCCIFNFHWTGITSSRDGLQRILWINPFCTIGMFLPSRLPSYSIFCIRILA